jgi:alpha-tubulin suppressor-like RCC1 family protein
MAMWTTRMVLQGLLAVSAVTMVGCGGGSDNPPPATVGGPEGQPTMAGTATVGGPTQSAPVTLAGPVGATITVPPGAVREVVTLRLAQDATGAPALPAGFRAASPIFAATPHGTQFDRPVRVEIPAPTTPLGPNESFLLYKAQPNGLWQALPTTQLPNGRLTADVGSLSYFIVAIITRVQGVMFEPWNASITVSCGAQDCNALTDIPTVTLNVTSNRGALTGVCNAAGATSALRIQAFSQRLFADIFQRDVPLGSLDAAGGPVSLELGRLPIAAIDGTIDPPSGERAPQLRDSGVTFVFWLVCGAVIPPFTFSTTSQEVIGPFDLRLRWRTPSDQQPEVLVLRMDSAPVPASGAGRVSARLAGGASFMPSFPQGELNYLRYVSPTLTNRALVTWERSDDGGASWVTAASSWQTDGEPYQFNADPLIRDWRHWTVSHEYTMPARTTGDVRFRARACVASSPTSTYCTQGAPIVIPVSGTGVAPVLSVSPRPVLILDGQTATFDATVAGTPAPTLQWQTRPANSNGAWADVTGGTGATAGTYTTPVLTLADNGRQYRVVATNSAGQIASAPVTASVTASAVAAQITTQPANLSVAAGGDAVFAVSATGTEPLSYQWRRNGQNIAGANGAVLRLSSVAAGDDGAQLSVVVSNAAGTAQSQAAQLRVTAGAPAAVAPTIVTQPTGVTARRGQTATFGVGVNGTGPFSFQWRLNGNAIAGATAAVYSIASVADADAGSYSVVVSNSVGSVTSGAAALAIAADPPPPTPVAPSITTQPAGLVVLAGNSATFAVAATGTGPLAYQWSRDGTDISGATGPVLALSSVQAGDAGSYTVRVSNAAGAVTSNGAQLIVPGAPFITLQNLGVTGYTGRSATFELFVVGNPAPSCQWLRNSVAIAGATSCTGYTTPPLTLAESGAVYNVVAYNAAGTVFGAGALLTVENPVAPVITEQPTSQNAPVNGSANFFVGFTSAPLATPAWRINGTELPFAFQVPLAVGACTGGYSTTGGQLQLTGLSAGCNGAQLNVTLANFAGSVTSNTATLTVGTSEPTMTQQPQNVTVTEGQPATFTAAVANAPHVQWERGGDIPGATSVTYTIPSPTLVDNGAVFRLRACTLPGAVGLCVFSNFVTLTVIPSVPANALTATQVIANNDNSLVIRPDGSVWGWGRNISTAGTHHESGVTAGAPSSRPVRLYPSTLTDVRQLISSYGTFFALRGDGTVWHWGRADNYVDGLGADGLGGLTGSRSGSVLNLTPVQMLERRVVSGVEQAVPLDRVCQVAYAYAAVVLLRAIDNGGSTTSCDPAALKTVWVVGRIGGTSAQFNMAQRINGLPAPMDLGSSVRAVYGSGNANGNVVALFMAQTGDGRWFAWGHNRSGRTGVPASPNSFFGLNGTFVEVPGNPWGTAPAQFVFGNDFNYALYADGSVRAAGFRSNNTFSLGDGVAGTGDANPPVSVVSPSCTALPCAELMSGATSIGASGGRFASVVVRNGELYGWGGEEFYGTTGVATNTSISYTRFPNRIGTLVGVTAVSVGFYHGLAIGPGGVVYSWGYDAYGLGQAGQLASVRSAVPAMVTVP